MMTDDPHDGPAVLSEREKWDADQSWRQAELSLRREELRKGRSTHPIVVVIIGGCLTAAFGMWTTHLNSQAGQVQETARAEAARILEVVKTGDPDTAAKNLQFLADVGLVTDERVSQKLHDYIANRLPGQGISLPQSNGVAKPADPKSSEADDRAADAADLDRSILKSSREQIEMGMSDPDKHIGMMGALLNSRAMGVTRDETIFALRSLSKVSQATRCAYYPENRIVRRLIEEYASSTDQELRELAKQALHGC
jgi:hypothetical protein